MSDIKVELKHPSVKLDHLLEAAFPRQVHDLLRDVNAPNGEYTLLVRGVKDIAGRKSPKKRFWGFDLERTSGYILVHARPVEQGKSRYNCALIPPPRTDRQMLATALRLHVNEVARQATQAAAQPPLNRLVIPPATSAFTPSPAAMAMVATSDPMKLAKLAGCARDPYVAKHFVTWATNYLGIRRVMTHNEARDIFKEAFDFPRTQTEKGIGRVISQFAKLGHITALPRNKFQLPGEVPVATPAAVVKEPTQPELIQMLSDIGNRLDTLIQHVDKLTTRIAATETIATIKRLLSDETR